MSDHDDSESSRPVTTPSNSSTPPSAPAFGHKDRNAERPASEIGDDEDTADAVRPAIVRSEPRRAPAGARFFTKQEVIKVDDSVYEDVPVPEWDKGGPPGWLKVKGLTTGERSKVEARLLKQTGDGGAVFDATQMRQLFCAFGIVDPDTGGRMFSDKEVHLLAAKSAAALDRVYEAVTRLSRMSKDDLKELVGNSPADPSDDSSGGTAND